MPRPNIEWQEMHDGVALMVSIGIEDNRTRVVVRTRRPVNGRNTPPRRRPPTIDAPCASVTLSSAIGIFLDDCRIRQLSDNTQVMYRDALDRLEAHLGGENQIDTVSARDLKGFVERETNRGLSPKTIKIRQACVKRLFRFLVEEELLDADPSAGLHEILVPERSWKPLTLEDVQSILDHMDLGTPNSLRNRLLVLMMVDSGGRVSEIAGIKAADIDLGGLRIRVTVKGGRERYLNITHNTRLLTARYLRKLTAPGKPAPVYLFENPDYGKPLTRAAIGKIVRKAGEAAGIPNVHPHRFRHTFTSEYVAAGGDAFTLQRELGHSSIQMSKHYVTLYDSSVQRKHQEFSPASKLIVRRER